jgi:hypothetical protein
VPFVKYASPVWQDTIALPTSVPFVDYSGMSIDQGRVAIVSQVNSMLWVGQFDEAGWQWRDEGQIYEFPRFPDGALQYGAGSDYVVGMDTQTVDAPAAPFQLSARAAAQILEIVRSQPAGPTSLRVAVLADARGRVLWVPGLARGAPPPAPGEPGLTLEIADA